MFHSYEVTELYQILIKHRGVLTLPCFVLYIKYVAYLRNCRESKTKIRPNFALFDPPPVKLGEVRANFLSRNSKGRSVVVVPADCLRFMISFSVC